MFKKILLMMLIFFFAFNGYNPASADVAKVKLGDEMLFSKYHDLIYGKNVGLVTNQTGVNSQGESIIDVISSDNTVKLTAIYTPEHGLDGLAAAGKYVESYTHPKLGIPVYSLYGETRMPTEKMLKGIDVLVFDIQDIGSRTYTYMSTLNYCMVAAKKYGKTVIVLDRPNPLGGETVYGPMLKDSYITFVGVDNLPMAHGMTAGELAQFFNRKIQADLKVVPMEGYKRDMVFQDTGLPWKMTSPNIPDLDAAFGYMATGLGEGTGIFMGDKFKWIGGKGIDSQKFGELLNNSGLPGVKFVPEIRGTAGGVRLQITDYHTFNPAKSGFYALAYAHSLNNFSVPKSDGKAIPMFEKIMGSDEVGKYLDAGMTPKEIDAKFALGLEKFKNERENYLIYKDNSKPNQPIPSKPTSPTNTKNAVSIIVSGTTISTDIDPYINTDNRVMLPLRAIAEALSATVTWNTHNSTINIVKDEIALEFTINKNSVIVNGMVKKIDSPPVLRQNRTMIPLRAAAELLGVSVNWDAKGKIVNIY